MFSKLINASAQVILVVATVACSKTVEIKNRPTNVQPNSAQPAPAQADVQEALIKGPYATDLGCINAISQVRGWNDMVVSADAYRIQQGWYGGPTSDIYFVSPTEALTVKLSDDQKGVTGFALSRSANKGQPLQSLPKQSSYLANDYINVAKEADVVEVRASLLAEMHNQILLLNLDAQKLTPQSADNADRIRLAIDACKNVAPGQAAVGCHCCLMQEVSGETLVYKLEALLAK
jgi:hypothetical protein